MKFNTFLLDISLRLINYVKNNNLHDFVENFISIYQDDFFSGLTDEQAMVFERTSTLSDQLNNLDCCSEHNVDYEVEIQRELNEYLHQLLNYIKIDQIVSRLSTLPKEFHMDYAITWDDLIKNNIDLSEAEKSMSYWSGAISDETMQEIIILIRYSYLRHLLNMRGTDLTHGLYSNETVIK